MSDFPSPSPSPDRDGSGSHKRLRVTYSTLEDADSLEELMRRGLPDKAQLFGQWLEALGAPSVCITSLEDVQRLDAEDIGGLPVPPLLKGIFREVIKAQAARKAKQQTELQATAQRKKDFMSNLKDRNMQPVLAGSKYFQDARSYRLIAAREEIEAGVRIIARKIETWCKGERIVLVGILKGAYMLMSDLCRTLVRPYSVYFVEASSYKDDRTQGALSIASELSASKFCDAFEKTPHKIVLVDELLDNGKTMEDMKQHFLAKLSKTHTEKDILTVCLFSKKRSRVLPEADITGIPNLPDLWLVGYGLDDRGTKRGWTELFAIPKVRIVETILIDQVQALLQKLDDSLTLNANHVFANLELPFSHKQKYRLYGLDVNAAAHCHADRSSPTLQSPECKVTTKADIMRLLASVGTVKDKYERELAFAFIQENVELVPEDSIFSGNNQVYAELRCNLRKQLTVSAMRAGVRGPDAVAQGTGASD